MKATVHIVTTTERRSIPVEGLEALTLVVDPKTPTQGKRAQHIARSATRAQLRRTITAVLAQSETLALDNERDRAQLIRVLVAALAP